MVVLLGAPGAGKGTQAQILSQRLGLAHVATGDLFRAAVRDGTPLGVVAKGYMDRGELVPDSVTIEMLLERLAQPDAAAGILLDGFPRNTAQAEVLDKALAERGSHVEVAPYIEVPEADLVARLGGRWICRAQGHPYHQLSKPPLVTGRCDVDGSELYQRTDDQPATVQARLRQQLGALDEVVAHYRRLGALKIVDGTGPIERVSDDLLAAIGPAAAA
ncbi:MAG TPA: nucleoside monophosphate kinase [Candidatus Limnocylindrales bacterium]